MECPSGIGGTNRHGICMGLPREAWCRGVYIYFRIIDLEGILFKKFTCYICVGCVTTTTVVVVLFTSVTVWHIISFEFHLI